MTDWLLDQSGYNRPEPKDEPASRESKKARPIEEKESFRWGVRRIFPKGQGDYGLRPGRGYGGLKSGSCLPRLNRTVSDTDRTEPDDGGKQADTGRDTEEAVPVGVTIPQDSRSGIPEREVVLQLRYAPFTVKRPHILNPVKTLPESVEVNVIYVREEHPPKGKAAIEWLWKLRFRDDQ